MRIFRNAQQYNRTVSRYSERPQNSRWRLDVVQDIALSPKRRVRINNITGQNLEQMLLIARNAHVIQLGAGKCRRQRRSALEGRPIMMPIN